VVGDGSHRYGGCETLILGNEPGTHVAAMAAARDPHALRIRDALFDQMINPGEMVVGFPSAHIPEYAPSEFLAPAGAAARVGLQDGVAALQQGEQRAARAADP